MDQAYALLLPNDSTYDKAETSVVHTDLTF